MLPGLSERNAPGLSGGNSRSPLPGFATTAPKAATQFTEPLAVASAHTTQEDNSHSPTEPLTVVSAKTIQPEQYHSVWSSDAVQV